MAVLLNTKRGVTGRKLNFHLLQTVPLLCSAPVGPETMTQRIQEAQHHKSCWLVVSCHLHTLFLSITSVGGGVKTPLYKREKQDRYSILPLLCRLPRALTTAGLPTILQVLSSFHPPAVMTLVHPDPDFISLVLLQSFHLTFVKKKYVYS